jgi:hypothetical protein
MAGGGTSGQFPVSRCAFCGRDVLTHVRLDEAGDERRHCVDCDAPLDPDDVRWVAEDALADLGYGVHGDEAGGCGRPGCGRGRCGSRPPAALDNGPRLR